jgi:hypothetical protein
VPLFFGRTGGNRFDAPAGEYGVLYTAADAHIAFIEAFGRNPKVNVVSLTELGARPLTRVVAGRPLRLVDLTGPGLARIDADARLPTGSYDLAHRWSLALHEHPEQPDGLLYRSRFDPSRLCAAIFERAADALSTEPLGSLADAANATLLADILSTYEFGLID